MNTCASAAAKTLAELHGLKEISLSGAKTWKDGGFQVSWRVEDDGQTRVCLYRPNSTQPNDVVICIDLYPSKDPDLRILPFAISPSAVNLRHFQAAVHISESIMASWLQISNTKNRA